MENKAYETILGRRSIRAFQPKQVEQKDLDAVLQAGLYAPCGMGSQMVTLVAVQDPEVGSKLSAMNAAIMGTNSDPYYGAPTIVVVLASPERYTWVEDGSCALTVMMEAAHALGLGSCWIHRAREMFDSDEGKALLKVWGVPEGMRGVGALALGYPAVKHPKRPSGSQAASLRSEGEKAVRFFEPDGFFPVRTFRGGAHSPGRRAWCPGR